MSVTTHVHDALERVDGEHEHVSEELAAFDRFGAGVRDLDPVSSVESPGSTHRTGATAHASTPFRRTATEVDRTKRVCKLFDETVRPYSIADLDGSASLVGTMSEELGREIAVAVAPTTSGRFTAEVKEAILSAVAHRRAELRAMDRALDTETESLTAALEGVETTIDWLVEANETPLSDLGFAALRERHGTLASHRSRCAETVHERQDVLHRTTNHHATAGLAYQSLTGYLYRDSSTSYPVLSTATRLDALCEECQRTVRDHLTRRV